MTPSLSENLERESSTVTLEQGAVRAFGGLFRHEGPLQHECGSRVRQLSNPPLSDCSVQRLKVFTFKGLF